MLVNFQRRKIFLPVGAQKSLLYLALVRLNMKHHGLRQKETSILSWENNVYGHHWMIIENYDGNGIPKAKHQLCPLSR